jgi:phosphatidylinositol alpha 1,6-mannosyltransferase
MNDFPRVALFADTFHEINGAANVIRRLSDFARRRNRPFLCVRASNDETSFERIENFRELNLRRRRASLAVDGELRYDPFLWRYKKLIAEQLREFEPDVIHVTGLNDVSQLGFYFAHHHNIPAVASWHTNTHEYAARRLNCFLKWLPAKFQNRISNAVEENVMRGLMKLYFLAQVQLAPNEELVRQIQEMTSRPAFLMSRGVDAQLFAPEKRRRPSDGDKIVLGYVGRLQPEKNVRLLAEVCRKLNESKISNYEFVIVGEGCEDKWLEQNLRRVRFAGVLRGEQLAQTYADMDLFVFPSRTDAFGNVVLEAMAAGVPSVVMPEGGAKFLIENGKNGFVARSEQDFVETIVYLTQATDKLREMRRAARETALQRSWQVVFEQVYEKYDLTTTLDKKVRAEQTFENDFAVQKALR